MPLFDRITRLMVVVSMLLSLLPPSDSSARGLQSSYGPGPIADEPAPLKAMAPEAAALTSTLTIPPLPTPLQETKKEATVYLPVILAKEPETLLMVSSVTTASLAFDGTNDLVWTANLPSLSSFTLETWVKRTADSGDYEVLLSDLNGAFTQMMLELFIDSGNDYCAGAEDQFVYGQIGNDYVQCSGVRAEVGRWYHLAVARDGNGSQRFFVDGILQATEVNAPALVDSNGLFVFGQAGAAPAYRFEGLLDEVRLSSSAVYTSNFMPPGEPLSSDGSTVALWHLDVGRDEPGRRSRVHDWGTGRRQPDLASLLAYARLAEVSTDVLIDDACELELG